MRLSDKVVTTVGLEAGQDDRIWFDDEITGFGLRVRRSGMGSIQIKRLLGRGCFSIGLHRSSSGR
jgi:hypothetical protein